MEDEVKTEETPSADTTVTNVPEMEKEVKSEETAAVDATVMDVPVDETSEESAEDLASYKLKDVVSGDDEKVKKIIADQKEYLLQKAKESDLNWDEIEIDEDGHTPKITEEDKAIYAAATDDIFDKETLDFGDHGETNSDGRIYGLIAANPNFAWERHMDIDGVEREYACADVILYTALYPEANLIPGKP
jgi:hypothetical protein